MYKIGIDLGGTKIEGAILSADGKILFRERILTEQENGYGHILENIKKIYDQAKEFIKNAEHSLGLGTPGSISKKTGLLKNSNTLCLNERFTKEEVENLLGHSLAIQNDANCFALAEAQCGAGQNHNVVFGVIMGTGCGGGIVAGGRILEGPQSLAGEWGHMSIDPEGPLCYCGSQGCVETYISGGGAQNRYEKTFQQKLDFQEITKKYRNKEKQAVDFMEQFFFYYGRAMANLINVLDPDVIVLGGGVSNLEELYCEGRKRVQEMVFSDELTTKIVKNKLGDSAGVIGAALIGEEYSNEVLQVCWKRSKELRLSRIDSR